MIRIFSNPKILLAVLAVFVIGSLPYLFSRQPQNFSPPNISTVYALEEYNLTIQEARILEVVSGHAWQNHGAEVDAAIKCLSNNGTYKSYKTSFTDAFGKTTPTNVWICKDGQDLYAVVTTKFIKSGINQVARLVTAYRIANDLFPTLDDYISYIVLKWGAVEISYIIQKGSEIYLSPR